MGHFCGAFAPHISAVSPLPPFTALRFAVQWLFLPHPSPPTFRDWLLGDPSAGNPQYHDLPFLPLCPPWTDEGIFEPAFASPPI